MAEGNARIAPTAHYTAQAWVRAGFPNAHIFDTPTGRTMFNAAQSVRRLGGPLLPQIVRYENEHLYVRHFVHEERLRQLAPGYVLEIGAGLSPRGLSFASNDPKLTYVEVDLPGMARAKAERLKRAGVTPPGNYHLGSADVLGESFLSTLPAQPKKKQRVAIVTEGVADYLDMDEKRVAFTNIASVLRAAGGGTYQAEFYTRDRFARYPGIAKMFTTLVGMVVGASFEGRLFGSAEEGTRFLCQCGFDEARVLDAEALNPGPWYPPMDLCPWQLIEARVKPPKKTKKTQRSKK